MKLRMSLLLVALLLLLPAAACRAESPLAEKDGSVEAEAVILAAPGEALPDIEAWLLIRQGRELDSLIAAQHVYRAELGTVLQDEYAADGAQQK